MEPRISIKNRGLTDQQREGLDRLSLLFENLPEDRKKIFENEVLNMEATKQLILRLPPEIHKELKMLSVSREKTMTEIIIEWVKRETGLLREKDPVIRALLEAPIDDGKPSRYTDEELDQMVEDDKMTPEEHAEIDRAIAKRKAKR